MTLNNLSGPILVVDDEADIRDLMEMTLLKMGLDVETAVGVTDAKQKLSARRYALVLTDMRMPDGSGLEVVQHVVSLPHDTPVAVITAFGNNEQSKQALKAGAFDYLQKPITLAQLRSLVKSAVKINEPEPEPAAVVVPPQSAPADKTADLQKALNDALSKLENLSGNDAALLAGVRAQLDRLNGKPANTQPETPQPTVQTAKPTAVPQTDMPRLLGQSPQMNEIRHLIRRLSGSDVSVYIAGESGSGKEQAARSIHELSARADKPFIAVNCGAIPENLMESEFFGYKKGSFTGADSDRMGFFQHANGGTLFLDEVADLPLTMQVKLLRAIQEKAVLRLGEANETPVDVRIICATHKNLAALVESGAFRQDLYYRLNVVNITMPPLREMRGDLGDLINHMLEKYRTSEHPYELSTTARSALLRYSYPGNFRELENILERATALCMGNVIQPEDLQISAYPDDDDDSGYSEPVSTTDTAEARTPHSGDGNINLSTLPPFVPKHSQLQDYLDNVERGILKQALQLTGNNRTQAAKLLGISFRSMRYRLERLNIE